ncbi:hypothetical protein GOBAR_DD03467 [Gossypium barbadense]|nr:hypothetical protein GOBAR_DD03467 [Gossypium barbadense]
MYTNCLLLGLDPSIIGLGASNGTPRVGLFRHSNPKLGEQLLYFILSSLRGPAQSARVVQGIITELEAQGALPRSNSRVSSLATCCGPRFVELLWQLSLHALRESHRRNFAADVASNPLPAPLTDVAFSHAATLLPVTKARIALERRRFLKNAETAVQRQAMWSNLAHEMTAEFRGLCAEESSQVPPTDVLSVQSGDLDGKEQNDGFHTQFNEETHSRVDDRSGRIHQTVDVAEVIRRWTHALQRIHKQSLQLAKANDGEGPDILRSAHDGGTSGHAESLAATLAEHQQHLASFQVLINQLKEVAPAIQKSISDCTEKVNSISSNLPTMAKHRGQASSPIQAQSSGRTLESSSDDVGDITSKMSTVQLEKISASPPALKLPQLFSLTPNSSGKGGAMQKRAPLTPNSAGKGGNRQKQHTFAPQTNQIDTFSERNSVEQPSVNNHVDYPPQDSDNSYIQNLKRSVRQAALSTPSCNIESSRDSQSNESSEHFFVPVSTTNFSRGGPENKVSLLKTKRLFSTQTDNSLLDSHASNGRIGSHNYDDLPQTLNNLDSLNDYDQVNGFLSAAASSSATSDGQSFFDMDDAQDQVFSPPLLMDMSLLADTYEDLLAPLSETEAALMEH